MSISLKNTVKVRLHDEQSYRARLPLWAEFARAAGCSHLSYDPAWLSVLEQGLGHVPYVLEAEEYGQLQGILPLALVRSSLFGKFLVSMPYLNYGGVIAKDLETAYHLVDRAIELAERLNTRTLELRQEYELDHPGFISWRGKKVHMRLALPNSIANLWKQLDSKVRNQIRKGEKAELKVVWGGEPLLDEFYDVFSHNMRDLGTPVYSRSLFRAALRQFPDRVEICAVRLGRKPIAVGLLAHGWGVTEIPSASSLRRYNPTCANMLLYWNVLVRAMERSQTCFDFGRSSPDSPTYKFKAQWGAQPEPSVWHYHMRTGDVSDMRPDNPRNKRLIEIWKRLPVSLTRLIGPSIVRGIP
jgi:FemAB-related protein (PEP-CTERM system-associated)